MHFWYHTIILYGLAKKFVRFFSIILSWSSKGIKNSKGTANCNSLLTLFWACFCGCQAFHYTISFLYACVFSRAWLFFGCMDCSPPGFSVHGIFQARILEWIAISSSKGSFQSRDWTCGSCSSCIGRWILYHWVAWEALFIWPVGKINHSTIVFILWSQWVLQLLHFSVKLLETLSQCVAQLYQLYGVTFL